MENGITYRECSPNYQRDGEAATLSEHKIVKNNNRRKLVLHFDVRNTLLCADSIGHININQALNSYLTGVIWGKMHSDGWQPYSDGPSLTSPGVGAITYYKYMEQNLVRVPEDRAVLRKMTGDFTSEPHGKQFFQIYQKHLDLLEWKYKVNDDKLTLTGYEEKKYHYILPSFFKLIHHLHHSGRDFSIIIRTYGLDASNVLSCIKYSLAGNHPSFADPVPIKTNTKVGKIYRTESHVRFEHYVNEGTKKRTLTDEREIYNMLSNMDGICGFVDDFPFWQKHDYHHSTAKPMWIDPNDKSVQHIFFDDNIRVTDLEPDSIVNVRIFTDDDNVVSLPSSKTVSFKDMCLIQADLFESIENIDYFIQKVDLCEHNYNQYLQNFHS